MSPKMGREVEKREKTTAGEDTFCTSWPERHCHLPRPSLKTIYIQSLLLHKFLDVFVVAVED